MLNLKERYIHTAEVGRVNAPSTSWGLQRMLTPGIIYKLGLSTLYNTCSVLKECAYNIATPGVYITRVVFAE